MAAEMIFRGQLEGSHAIENKMQMRRRVVTVGTQECERQEKILNRKVRQGVAKFAKKNS
jgi:hypothetical protein